MPIKKFPKLLLLLTYIFGFLLVIITLILAFGVRKGGIVEISGIIEKIENDEIILQNSKHVFTIIFNGETKFIHEVYIEQNPTTPEIQQSLPNSDLKNVLTSGQRIHARGRLLSKNSLSASHITLIELLSSTSVDEKTVNTFLPSRNLPTRPDFFE